MTKIILEGALGKEFGREWELVADTPARALKLIDANKPGLFAWIRKNLDIYKHYEVVVGFEDGEMVEIDEDGLTHLPKKPTSIRFVPIVEGAGAASRIIAGVVIIAASVISQQYYGVSAGIAQFGIAMGASLALGGVISLLTPMQNSSVTTEERKDKTSYYFDGPVNTSEQGVAVPVIYGDQILVGSQAISVSVNIDQLI